MSDSFSLFSSMRFDTNLTQVPEKSIDNAGWNYRNKSPLYMLDFHRDRLLRAATHWQWDQVIELLAGDDALAHLGKKAEEFVGQGQDTPLLLKAVVDQKGTLEFSKFDTPPTTLERLFPQRFPEPGTALESDDQQLPPPFTALLDDVPIARSEYTHFKTTRRAMYDAARHRAGITAKNRKEVLIVNQDDGSVMEGSITTPYFWRDGDG